MKRTSLLVIAVFLFLILAAGCGGQKEPAPAATEIVAQASELTPTSASVEAASTATTQAGAAGQSGSASSPTAEPTLEPTPEQAAPTEVPASTPETSSTGSSSSPAPTQTAASPDASACVNKAAFYEDVTIPDDTVLLQSDKFTKTWRIRNEGDCNWQGYQLVYAGGEAMNASLANPVPNAGPGEIIDISVDMTAPNRGGTYLSYWQFSSTDGKTFGVGSAANGMLWARIQVDYGAGQEVSTDSTGTAQAGSTSTTSVSTSGNTTTTTVSTGGNTTSSNTPANCDYSQNSGYENQILVLINKARADNGLGSVSRDSQLDAAALEHSLDMACNDFISHTGSDGSLWYQRVSKQGFANSNAARENIYTGSPDFGGDANGAFTWWMNSQIHRDNILYDSVSLIGISYVYSKKATYGGLYTLVLARP